MHHIGPRYGPLSGSGSGGSAGDGISSMSLLDTHRPCTGQGAEGPGYVQGNGPILVHARLRGQGILRVLDTRTDGRSLHTLWVDGA